MVSILASAYDRQAPKLSGSCPIHLPIPHLFDLLKHAILILGLFFSLENISAHFHMNNFALPVRFHLQCDSLKVPHYRVILYCDMFTFCRTCITVHICFSAVCLFPKATIILLSCILLYLPAPNTRFNIRKLLLMRQMEISSCPQC